MNDNNADRELRRFFAETQTLPSDDLFVRQVRGRIRRHQRWRMAMMGSLAIAAMLTIVGFAPIWLLAFTYVADLATRLTGAVLTFSLSPAGVVLPILVGLLVLWLPPESSW